MLSGALAALVLAGSVATAPVEASAEELLAADGSVIASELAEPLADVSSATIGEAMGPDTPRVLAETRAEEGTVNLRVSGTERYDYAWQVLDLVNAERAKAGKKPLAMDKELLAAAMQRAAEITLKFEHTRPNGELCFTASSKMTGENIAAWQTSPAQAMQSWMASSGHKANILGDYTMVGIGVFSLGGQLYWVQDFGGGSAQGVSKPANKNASAKVAVKPSLFGLTASVVPSTASGKTALSLSGTVTAGSTQRFMLVLANKQGQLVAPDQGDVTWKSGDDKVAAFGKNATVAFKASGKLTVTATSSGGLVRSAEGGVTVLANGEKAMQRLYNPYSGEHLYTESVNERDTLADAGWRYENLGWVAPKASKTPVYRLYNPYSGDHHYTTNAGERDALAKAGWRKEGTGWYSDDAKGQPLYRQFNPYERVGTHNYTTSKNENDTLVKQGWRAEGIAWYGVKAGK